MTFPLAKLSSATAAIVAAAVTVLAAMPARAETGTLTVPLDRATLVKMPERLATLVIGNPLVADVTVQANGLLVVTGKGFGSTNLIALDKEGAVLLEKAVQVVAPREQIVTVYKGINRETYSCEPQCAARITLGDSPGFFNPTIAQAGVRTTQARAAAGR